VSAADLPQGIDPPATSLLLETGSEVDRVELLVELLDRLERAYDEWVATTGT
jgi:biotin-(acetyl-CoA carboxylase) ligase